MGCHDGHRERLKNKYLKMNGNGLEDHELLEMMLFYSIPRVNTNEIAHRLLERFGSMQGVFDADINELGKIEGIGANSAILIKLISSLFSRYQSENTDCRKPFVTFSQISEYLLGIFAGASKEMVYSLMFNNSMKLIKSELVGMGTVNIATLNSALIVKSALNYDASYVMLAHNHPDGLAIPSSSDIETTHRLNQALATVNINFVEHFVVASGKCTPILHELLKDSRSAYENTISQNLRATDIEIENDLDTILRNIVGKTGSEE